MANKIPVKAIYSGSDVTSLGELASGDTIASTWLDLSAGTGITISGSGVIAAGAISLSSVQTAANQSAHLALTTEAGDIVVRSDENKTYCHNGGSAGTMSDFTLLATPTDVVLSVGGNVGAVTNAHIAAAVEAASDSNTFTDADHTKLNAIEASANLYVHPNHSGDVVSAADGTMTIQTDAVDIAMLSASGTASSSTFLRGDNAWVAAGSTSASDLTSGTLPSARLGTITNFTSTGIDDNADALAITIDSSEKVGIGTTTLYGKTTIKHASGINNGLTLHVSDSTQDGNISGIQFSLTTSVDRPRAAIYAISTTKDSSAGWAADLVFATRGAADASTISTSNERMRIDQNGNVGIGNSSPNEKLHVTGNVKVTGSLYTSDLILNNLSKDSPNSVDGTRGHWRIQEGEDNLYIINEISGKKFKFKIQEVE